VVVVLDCDVPWIPNLHPIDDRAKVIHIGDDPLFGRYPMRSFRADLAIAGDSAATLAALDEALSETAAERHEATEARRARLAAHREELEDATRRLRESAGAAITPAWVAHCLGRLKGADDLVVAEPNFPIALLDFPEPRGYFGTSPAGGLGWALGAALGAKLAAPERRVIAAVGDGSYMFGNPTPAHFVSAALGLPTLTIILNNRMWASVRRATLSLYPDGAAAKANRAPLTYLEPAPDYERVVEASGGYGEKVERPDELLAALARALAAVDQEGRQAVLNVLTEYPDDQAVQDARR
jgi:acetolactate synthase-1/2/3 large subunit